MTGYARSKSIRWEYRGWFCSSLKIGRFWSWTVDRSWSCTEVKNLNPEFLNSYGSELQTKSVRRMKSSAYPELFDLLNAARTPYLRPIRPVILFLMMRYMRLDAWVAPAFSKRGDANTALGGDRREVE